MKRRRQLLALLAATSAVLLVVGAGLAFAVKHEPAFYRRALLAPGVERHQLAQEFMIRSTDFYNSMNTGQIWALSVSQTQLNAHLQDEQFAKSSLFTFPEGVTEPRIEFDEERIRIGFRYGAGWLSAIVSVDMKTWLVAKESNVIALELCGVYVGGIPLGSHLLMEYVSEAAREENTDVTWYRSGNHPVALLRLQANQTRPTQQLRRFEVRPGEVLLHGKPTIESGAPPIQ
jgi:hypothetical protein